MHIFKKWILSFGIKKLAIISTVAVVGVTGTTIAITSVKNSENAVVEEEKIVINTQSDEDEEAEVEKDEEVTEEVTNQEVVTEATTEVAEDVKEQTSTNTTTSSNSNNGSTTNNTTTSNNSSGNTTNNNTATETTKVDTIVLHVKTRYAGFSGFFTKDRWAASFDLEKYGIVNTSTIVGWSCYLTEYCDVDTGEHICFVGGDIPHNDFAPYDDRSVLGKTKVKVIDGEGTTPEPMDLSGCQTITLFIPVTYMGYTGHFTKETYSHTGRGYAVYMTEYYDGVTGENVGFVYDDPNFDDLKFEAMVRKAGLGTVPVKVVSN